MDDKQLEYLMHLRNEDGDYELGDTIYDKKGNPIGEVAEKGIQEPDDFSEGEDKSDKEPSVFHDDPALDN